MLKQEERVIQPHAERIEIVIPSTAEVRKEKMGAASEASREQNGSPVEKSMWILSPGHVRICQG